MSSACQSKSSDPRRFYAALMKASWWRLKLGSLRNSALPETWAFLSVKISISPPHITWSDTGSSSMSRLRTLFESTLPRGRHPFCPFICKKQTRGKTCFVQLGHPMGLAHNNLKFKSFFFFLIASNSYEIFQGFSLIYTPAVIGFSSTTNLTLTSPKISQ